MQNHSFRRGESRQDASETSASVAPWNLLAEVHVGKQNIVLCHYAIKAWPHHARGTWQLYGYSHGNLPDDLLLLSMDVGVDSHDFRPWHFDEIQVVMKAKAEAKAKHLEMR